MKLQKKLTLEVMPTTLPTSIEVPVGKNLGDIQAALHGIMKTLSDNGIVKIKATNESGQELIWEFDLYQTLHNYTPRYMQSEITQLDRCTSIEWTPRFGTHLFKTLVSLLPGMTEVCKQLHKQYPDEWAYKGFKPERDLDNDWYGDGLIKYKFAEPTGKIKKGGYGDDEKEFQLTDKGKEFLLKSYSNHFRFMKLINQPEHKAAITVLLPEIEARTNKRVEVKNEHIRTTNKQTGL